MAEIINAIISTVLQLAVFTLIPFIFFLFRKNKSIKFFEYIGFYKPTGHSVILVIITAIVLVITGVSLIIYNEGMREIILAPKSVTGMIRGLGFNFTSVIVLLITALIKTSLSEEIFFRGFIAKRLIVLFGFSAGNILQAAIFGAVHLFLFWKIMNAELFFLVFIFIFSTLAGWIIGLIKEKYANGSIIPGWIAHGLGNTISYTVIAYII